MKITGTANGWQVFSVATSVTFRIVGIEACCAVKRLMNVTDVVDNHTKCKRSGICILREVLCDLFPVVRIKVVTTRTLEPLGSVGKSSNNIILIENKVWVVIKGVTVNGERLVNKVPPSLEAVNALNVICEC